LLFLSTLPSSVSSILKLELRWPLTAPNMLWWISQTLVHPACLPHNPRRLSKQPGRPLSEVGFQVTGLGDPDAPLLTLWGMASHLGMTGWRDNKIHGQSTLRGLAGHLGWER
jgi:hypothetical protein